MACPLFDALLLGIGGISSPVLLVVGTNSAALINWIKMVALNGVEGSSVNLHSKLNKNLSYSLGVTRINNG